jgi:NADH-quinone oxidoreductase subunit F
MKERPLTRNLRRDRKPLGLDEYERGGGYRALRKALLGMTPAEVLEEVKQSDLRGRGGAGFPTGLKWSFMPSKDGATCHRYLVANADEMEPGTFKDKLLLEGNPHQLLEGMILAAYAIQADVAYVFLRWAYRQAARTISRAIAEAYDAGYLGGDVLKSSYSLELQLHISAGRYICGEETGLLNALEGQRPTPRARPPYPQVCGLWGRDTIVNNVETLCNIPHIVSNGAEWFKGLSLSEDGGTKLYGVSGRVKNPGLWELPMGTTIRQVLENHAGGMREGFAFKGVLPGGASTDFLTDAHLDVKMDFDSVSKAGSRMGTGTMIVLDDRTCPVGMLISLQRFFARESCGWCTPCRDGLPWVVKMLQAIEDGQGQPDDLEHLTAHTRLLGPGHTYCVLAPGAMEPLQSALKYFHEDFEQHIRQQRCSWQEYGGNN